MPVISSMTGLVINMTGGTRMSNINPKEVIDGLAVMCSYDKLMNIADIISIPQNRKQYDDNQIELLAQVIKSQGWRAPIIVSTRSGFVVRGFGRLMAAQKLGAQFVPIKYKDYENQTQEWADMFATNRVVSLADTDEAMLKDLLQEIKAGAFDIDSDLT
jgi:ParB-like chromosome segregation protein Spo0J